MNERAPSRAIPEADYYEAKPAINVYSWSPAPAGTVDAKATQVHLHIGAAPGPVFVVRINSAATLDGLIAALELHRTDVWGERPAARDPRLVKFAARLAELAKEKHHLDCGRYGVVIEECAHCAPDLTMLTEAGPL